MVLLALLVFSMSVVFIEKKYELDLSYIYDGIDKNEATTEVIIIMFYLWNTDQGISTPATYSPTSC